VLCYDSPRLAAVTALVASAQRGHITSEEYSNAYEEIKDTVDKGFYLNGTLLITMLSNTIAGRCTLSPQRLQPIRFILVVFMMCVCHYTTFLLMSVVILSVVI